MGDKCIELRLVNCGWYDHAHQLAGARLGPQKFTCLSDCAHGTLKAETLCIFLLAPNRIGPRAMDIKLLPSGSP